MESQSSFYVERLDIEPELARKFMYRSIETAYREGCGVHFKLPNCAPVLKEGGRYRESMVDLSKKLVSARTKRLTLLDEAHSLSTRLAKYKEVENRCRTNTKIRTERIIKLEKEMDYLTEVDDAQPTSRLSAVLAQPQGWDIVVSFLKKEYRKSQQKKVVEVVDKKNYVEDDTTDPELVAPLEPFLIKHDVEVCWALLQEWRLFCTFEMAGRIGIKGSHHRKGDLEMRYEHVGSDDDDEYHYEEVHNTDLSASGADQSSKDMSANAALLNAALSAVDSVERSPDKSPKTSRKELMQEGSVKSPSPSKKKKKSSGKVLESFPIAPPPPLIATAGDGPRGNRRNSSKKGKKLKVLESTLGGHGPFSSWQTVCEYIGYYDTREETQSPNKGVSTKGSARVSTLGTPISSIGLMDGATACARYLADEESPLSGFISYFAVNEVANHFEYIRPGDDTSLAFGSSVVRVLDDLAESLEKVILAVLRSYPPWVMYLEGLRKNRIQEGRAKEGDVGEYGDIQTDTRGQTRVVPYTDDVIETDMLHPCESITQHLLIVNAHPLIVKKIKEVQRDKYYKVGELCCVYQYGASLATPHIQRVMRGTIDRMKRTRECRELAYAAYTAAAVTLQAWTAGRIARWRFLIELERQQFVSMTHAATRIQACVRGWLAMLKYIAFINRKIIAFRNSQAVIIQAVVRGFLDRRRLQRVKAEKILAHQNAVYRRCAIKIQKIARGFVGRKRIIPSKYVRNTLSCHALQLGKRYLQKGDLWGFLKEVGDEFNRLNTVIDDAADREKHWAETFIDNVLHKRQRQFEDTWDNFADAVRTGTQTDTDRAAKISTLRVPDKNENEQILTAMSRSRAKGGTMPSNALDHPNNIDTCHASSQKMESRSLKATKMSSKSARSPIAQLGQDHALAAATYGVATKKKGIKGKKPKAIKHLVDAQTGSTVIPSNMGTSIPGPLLRRAVSSTVQNEVQQEMERQKKGESRSLTLMDDFHEAYDAPIPGSRASSRMGTGSGTLSKSMSASSVNRGGSNRVASRQSGSAPKVSTMKKKRGLGLADVGGSRSAISSNTIDWVSAAGNDNHLTTAIVGKRVPPGESYLIDIPHGLRDSIENLVHAACIRVFSPDVFQAGSDGHDAYQVYLNMAPGLAKIRYETEAYKWGQGCVDMLKAKGCTRIDDILPISKFMMLVQDKEECPVLLSKTCIDIINSLKKTQSVVLGYTHKESKSHNQMLMEGTGSIHQIIAIKRLGEQEDRRKAILAGVSETDETDGEDGEFEDVGVEVVPGDGNLPRRLLQESVNDGPWNRLTATIEDMFTHSAFLVCPHTVANHGSHGSASKDTVFEGHKAFKKYVSCLQSPMLTEAEKRKVTKARYQLALTMATPFCLKLKSMGVEVVKDLLLTDLTALHMPQLLQKQVESLLNVVVSSTVNTKETFSITNHEPTNKELYAAAAPFDRRFQRGPLDPYGQAPLSLGSYNSPSKWSSPSNHRDATLVSVEGSGLSVELPAVMSASMAPTSTGSKKSRKVRSTASNANTNFDVTTKVGHTAQQVYVCSYPNCNQSFNRPYTLKVHERSHENFDYYNQRTNKKNSATGANSSHDSLLLDTLKYLKSSSLPPMARQKLDKLERVDMHDSEGGVPVVVVDGTMLRGDLCVDVVDGVDVMVMGKEEQIPVCSSPHRADGYSNSVGHIQAEHTHAPGAIPAEVSGAAAATGEIDNAAGPSTESTHGSVPNLASKHFGAVGNQFDEDEDDWGGDEDYED